MLLPDEILAIVKEKVEIAKPYIQNKGDLRGFIGEDKKGMLPEYYDGYNIVVQEYESIKIHTDKGVFPQRLFTERSPNQTDEEFSYIKNNYKQTTLPVFMDYISSITRPFHRSNWSIEFQEDAPQFGEEGLQEYLKEMKLESYMRQVVPALKTKDAEGVIAIKPKYVPLLETEEGFEIADELIDPSPVYYESPRVITDSKEYVLIEIPEKSIVTEGNRQMQVGLCYEFYDDTNIWIIKQYGRRIDFTFEAELYYPHNWGKVPVTKLKGVPFVCSTGWRWQSPYLFAVDNLDLVVLNQSNLQASINKCVYPVRVMVGDVCDFEDHNGHRCDGGIIQWYNDEGIKSSKLCNNCGGSGLRSRLSPTGELLLHPISRENEGEGNINNPLSYVSPEVTTLEFLRTEIKEHEARARNILHLKQNDSKTQGSEQMTATEVATDMKALAAFVNTISDQMFDLMDFVIDAVGYMRYGESYREPQINKPTTFDYTTEEDYVYQISVMTEAGVPPMILHQVIRNYLNTIYMVEEMANNVFTVILAADRLLGLTSEDIKLKSARGVIQPFEDVIHCSAITLIDELVRENANYFEQDLEVQVEQLKDRAKSKLQSPEQDIVNAITTPVNTI